LQAVWNAPLAVAFDDSAHVLTFYASHDDALVASRTRARLGRLHLDIRMTGSWTRSRVERGALSDAGFHTLEQPSWFAGATHYKPLLSPVCTKSSACPAHAGAEWWRAATRWLCTP